MIYLVPLEPLHERYTEQWSRWIPGAFEKLSEPTVEIKGLPLTDTIESGSVLDSEGTNYFKFSQLMQVMEMIRANEFEDGDTLFFYDLWFPGIEAIKYSCAIRKLDLKIVGVLHAGSYDPNDFITKAGMGYWAKPLEQSWMRIYDRIFVGSQYHKKLIMENYPCTLNKIAVTHLPFSIKEVVRPGVKKEKIVVFPHRLDAEKQPELFDKLKAEVIAKYPKFAKYKWIKTKDVCNTKEEYYQLLSKASIAVSFSLQETFGIAMLEAFYNGCFCFVPHRLSYKTEWEFCYKGWADLVDRIGELEETSGKLPCSSVPSGKLRGSLLSPTNVVARWIQWIKNL